ncbi:MAG TPA: methionyl-tRNA formyltransferase [Kiritimatiellia bacterium]|nr:methionyl-tRNA formyltransferase [Kiritimatiellia bacterium]HMO98977.1 methionyl-tRNA formyltransferase [Kiritimatiellia bacterium]HMP96688.1 methionyl-tRNA formyltransferase [Kiritimatiellia bacterium]
MNLVFFGSSSFSLPAFLALASAAQHRLVGVAAQPDRPSGRNRRIQPGIIHQAALDHGIPIILPEKIGAEDAMATLRAWAPDAIAVASYGQYIPTRVLNLPPHGAVNVHPSLLPKYRGAAPLQWSIARGETLSGVTIFRVVKDMDAGDILAQEQHAIEPDETATQLSDRFSRIGADMLLKVLDQLEGGTALATPQDHAAATYAPKIEKHDGLLDWQKPAIDLHNRIRGFQPWPGCYFHHEGRPIKVWRSRPEPGGGEPGAVVDTAGPGPLIMTGDQALRLLELQPEGKKPMPGDAFLRGIRWTCGLRLG